MIKWKVTSTLDIERKEVTRETPKFVFYYCDFWRKECRESKDSAWGASYHDTFEDAKRAVIGKRRQNVANLELQLQQAREWVEKALKLEEPPA